MLERGVYPASVTPLTGAGQTDPSSLKNLLTSFAEGGCKGVVLAGTNGEGPSLGLAEKASILEVAAQVCGDLEVVLGIATSSLADAIEMARLAGTYRCVAILAMPPMYFREATEAGIEAWFRSLLDESPIPALVYNLPKRTGVAISAELLASLIDHPKFAGAKDSSGEQANLASYAEALAGSGKALFVGDETLLIDALDAGWTGTISGAANIVPAELARVVSLFEVDRDAAKREFEAVLPTIRALRSTSQPATNKAILARRGIIGDAAVKLPLVAISPGADLPA